ncbi:MAG TPA: tRNA epoxyqueuosine(34) reductase QueG [Terriglobales bacterium]|nr:tRNA epoxyqueuosine(34) reductase QueG [Terriglobales bacterium]
MPVAQLTRLVKEAAAEAGFELAGIAGIGDFPELGYFQAWIEQGYAAEMAYLQARDEQGGLKRASLRSVAPWARSVVICALNYNVHQPYSTQAGNCDRGWVSRYAWGRRDYHKVVMQKLRALESKLHAIGSQQAGGASQEIQTRAYVDTGPLVERVYAKHAGLGWIGKNTCIINQRLGSWLFLGVILTSLELAPDLPAPDRCGSCTRCIDACPTEALIAPYQLDSNRCISYLTIEKRGSIPEEMREGMGRQVFGCDICQDVCPWNRKAPASAEPDFQPRPELVNPALDWLAAMAAEQFAETFRGSPVRRAKWSGLRRNAVIAMGNSGNSKFLPRLEKLTQDEDPVLAECARWTLKRLRERSTEEIQSLGSGTAGQRV